LTGGAVYFFGYVNENYVLLFPGMLILLIGSLLLMPHVIEKLIHGVLKVVGRRLGRLVYLTFKNMLPQVRRNAFAVISVSLTLTIVVFGTTLLHTLDANNLRFLKENYEKPIMLYNRLGSESTLDHQWLHDTLLAFDSIREVQYEGVLLLNYLMLSDENVRITPLAVYSPLVEGLKDDELVISKDLADQYHLQAGDEIVIGSFDAVTQDIVPVGVYRIGRISGELKQPDYALMTWYNPLNLSPTVSRIFIDPNDEAQALADLESVRAQFPELQVTTLNEAMEQAREGFIQRWGIFIVVLSVIIGCSMAGVLNGLMNQILSKRKEFAVLRTIGVSPAGILCNILVQVGLYVGLGIICGGLLGFLIFALVLAMDPAPVTFDFATIGLIGAGMLLLAVATFAIAGRHLSSGNIRREMAMDGT
jgi:putative ABC transport system permease protein